MVNDLQSFNYILTVAIALLISITIFTFKLLFSKTVNKNKHAEEDVFEISVVTTTEECTETCNTLLAKMELQTLGFDAEWITIGKSRQPVALIQLATHNYCALFRLNLLELIPEPLENILTCENIMKVGIIPERDASYILSDYGVFTKSTLDLRHLYRRDSGLSNLSSEILNKPLDKVNYIRCSNWEDTELSKNQLVYAAKDGIVAFQLYKYYHDNNCTNLLDSIISACLNQPYKSKRSGTTKQSSVNDSRENKLANFKFRKLLPKCRLFAPDNTMLCWADKGRGLWYVSKNKGEVICEDPFTVRLLFEPKQKPNDDEDLYEKEEIPQQCVVCGSHTNLVKHHIVPRMFIALFPYSEKSHYSHDIQFICQKCHRLVEMKNNILINDLKATIDYKEEPKNSLQCIQKHAKSLLHFDHLIPEERKEKLKEFILNKTNVKEINRETLSELLLTKQADASTDNPFAVAVINYFTSDRTLWQLQKLCRKYFVDVLKPRFLPKYWSIEFKRRVPCSLADEVTSSKQGSVVQR